MIKRLALSLFILLGLAGLAGLQPAYAASDDTLFPSGGDNAICTGEANNSAPCQDRTDKNPFTSSDGILAHITSIVAYIAGAAAIIVFIISGIRYITSGGDASKVSSAKAALINSAIGLVVIIMARTLIIYVLNKL